MDAIGYRSLGALVALTLGLGFGWTRAEPEPPEKKAASADAQLETEAAPRVPAVLSLEDAVALALGSSPELSGASWQVKAAEGQEVQAKKFSNPQLDLRFQRLGEQGGMEDVARRRVFLRQDFSLGGKRHRRVDLAQTDIRLADWSYRAKRSEITARVAASFAEVLGAQKGMELYRELVAYMEKLHGAAESMLEAGSLRRVEIQEIIQRLGRARIDLQQAEGDLAEARFGLAALWGHTSPEFDSVVGDLEPAGPLPTVDEVLKMAESSPSKAFWETRIQRSRTALDLARAGAVPDLEVGVGVAWEQGDVPPDYYLDLEIDLPFSNRNQGNIRAAHAEVSHAQALKDAAQAADARRVVELYYRISESEAKSSILGEDVIPAARAMVTAHRLGFEGQAEGLADLLDSRADLTRAEMQRIEALVDYRQALAELEHRIGSSLLPEN
jgi:cobalt-zinc-cadmium efflux system outer membrane protein